MVFAIRARGMKILFSASIERLFQKAKGFESLVVRFIKQENVGVIFHFVVRLPG